MVDRVQSDAKRLNQVKGFLCVKMEEKFSYAFYGLAKAKGIVFFIHRFNDSKMPRELCIGG